MAADAVDAAPSAATAKAAAAPNFTMLFISNSPKFRRSALCAWGTNEGIAGFRESGAEGKLNYRLV
jgi:hypothetical protein